MITLFFGICCAALYILALIFGVSYEEMSVIVCVDMVIWVCVISLVITNIVALWKLAVTPSVLCVLLNILLLLVLSFYLVNAGMYYDAQLPEVDYYHNFNWVMNKLYQISNNANTSYEFVNILIYCIIFPLIVISNLFTGYKIHKSIPYEFQFIPMIKLKFQSLKLQK